MFTIFFIESINEGSVALIRAPDGALATPVFQTQSAAEAFRAQLPSSEKWQVRDRRDASAIGWLKALPRNGVTFVVLEPVPSPSPTDEDFVSVEAFVMKLR